MKYKIQVFRPDGKSATTIGKWGKDKTRKMMKRWKREYPHMRFMRVK